MQFLNIAGYYIVMASTHIQIILRECQKASLYAFVLFLITLCVNLHVEIYKQDGMLKLVRSELSECQQNLTMLNSTLHMPMRVHVQQTIEQSATSLLNLTMTSVHTAMQIPVSENMINFFMSSMSFMYNSLVQTFFVIKGILWVLFWDPLMMVE